MEATQNAGRILMDSLQLLGISVVSASREYGCALSNDMFVQPNQKGFNALLHILFDCIRGKEAFRKDIKGAWPVKDSVGQREFNKSMQRLILELANAGHLPKHLSVHLPQSFRQLSGFRLTALLCYIAAHALSQEEQQTDRGAHFIHAELPGYSAALEPLYKSVRAQNAKERGAFVRRVTSTAQAQASWAHAAEALSTIYRSVRQASTAFAHEDALPTETGDLLAQQVVADESAAGSQADLLEASLQAEAAWSQLEAGAAMQMALGAFLNGSITHALHPHVIDGAALWASMFGEQASPASVIVSLPSLLQDWRGLLAETQTVLLEGFEVERLEAQGRPVVPLIAPEQQVQVGSASGQQESRLHTQKQLSTALQALLSSAVAQREALSWRLNSSLGLANPTVPCPRSPLKDLIPALYPEGKASLRAEGIMSPASLPNANKATGARLTRAQNNGKGLLERENIRAQLQLPAYAPTAFEDSLRPLQLYIANAPPTILESTGPTTNFASSFIPESTLACTGVQALREGTQKRFHQLETSRLPTEGFEAALTTAMLQKGTEPRRLSFSDTSPEHSKPSEVPASVDIKPGSAEPLGSFEAAPTVAGASVDDLMSRMERLRQASG